MIRNALLHYSNAAGNRTIDISYRRCSVSSACAAKCRQVVCYLAGFYTQASGVFNKLLAEKLAAFNYLIISGGLLCVQVAWYATQVLENLHLLCLPSHCITEKEVGRLAAYTEQPVSSSAY